MHKNSTFSPSFLTAVLCLCSLLIVSINAQSRTVTFENNCADDYYMFITSNAVGVGCTSDAQCPAGSSCAYPSAGQCYYTIPTPTSGQFVVPAGGSNSMVFPYVGGGSTEWWAGVFSFCKDQCTGTAASCLEKGCGVYSGPYNFVEVTFEKTIVDSYDISNINGFNVPLSVTPTGVTNSMIEEAYPYTCGNPGSKSPLTGIATSSWQFNPPHPYYQWVLPSDTICAQNSDCPSGEVCGLSNDPGKFVAGVLSQFQMNCGPLVGYWSAMELCGEEPDPFIQTGPFDCTLSLNNAGIVTTVGTLAACGGSSGSGYLPGANNQVCGCADWINMLEPGAIPPQTVNCTSTSIVWMQYIYPTVDWLKAACPSCYSYPKDDPSSTFTCGSFTNGINTQGYTVTLCPSGSSTLGTTTGAKSSSTSTTHAATSTTHAATSTTHSATIASTTHTTASTTHFTTSVAETTSAIFDNAAAAQFAHCAVIVIFVFFVLIF